MVKWQHPLTKLTGATLEFQEFKSVGSKAIEYANISSGKVIEIKPKGFLEHVLNGFRRILSFETKEYNLHFHRSLHPHYRILSNWKLEN